MPRGKVKFFDIMKGYGFMEPSEGEKDVFVHFKDLQAAGLTSLSENQEVKYKLTEERTNKSHRYQNCILTENWDSFYLNRGGYLLG